MLDNKIRKVMLLLVITRSKSMTIKKNKFIDDKPSEN